MYGYIGMVRRARLHAKHASLALACLAAFTLAGCGSGSTPEAADITAGQASGSGSGGGLGDALGFTADGGLDCHPDISGYFDLAAAAQAPTLLDDYEVGELGEDGARDLIDSLTAFEGSFCTADLIPETQAAIEEADRLAGDGREDEALDLLRGHMDELGSALHGAKLSAPKRDHAAGERRRMRSMLGLAAWVQKYVDPEGGIEFIDRAKSIFSDMADRDLPNATAKEALTIMQEAQLLGVEHVESDAWERAQEVYEQELNQELAGFNPCTATDEAAHILLARIANAMAVSGWENDTVTTAGEQWTEARKVLSRRAKGEKVPECGEPAALKWSLIHPETWVSNGEAWTCDGRSWHVDLTFELHLAQGDFKLSGGADFQVEGLTGKVTIPMEGLLVVSNGTADLTDEVDFALTIDEEGESGSFTLASSGAGMIVYGDGEVEDFGVVRPGAPALQVPFHAPDNCGT